MKSLKFDNFRNHQAYWLKKSENNLFFDLHKCAIPQKNPQKNSHSILKQYLRSFFKKKWEMNHFFVLASKQLKEFGKKYQDFLIYYSVNEECSHKTPSVITKQNIT